MTPEEMKERVASLSYDKAIQETETILTRLEEGNLPIDEVLSQSRYVVALIAHCKTKITDVTKEVDTILKELDDDQPRQQ